MTDEPQPTDQPSPKPKRRYGWWIFFALLMVLASLALTYLVPAYRQLALIERIEAAGGGVGMEPVGPEWLRNFLGERRIRGFDNVVSVAVDDALVDDEWLEEIGALPSLERLDLNRTQITDAGLFHLNRLAHLKWLCLNNTVVSDAGLVHLKELTNLKSLYLQNTQVSDAGLVHLKGLTKLEVLHLNNTEVSYTGAKQLHGTLPVCWIIFDKE